MERRAEECISDSSGSNKKSIYLDTMSLTGTNMQNPSEECEDQINVFDIYFSSLQVRTFLN